MTLTADQSDRNKYVQNTPQTLFSPNFDDCEYNKCENKTAQAIVTVLHNSFTCSSPNAILFCN